MPTLAFFRTHKQALIKQWPWLVLILAEVIMMHNLPLSSSDIDWPIRLLSMLPIFTSIVYLVMFYRMVDKEMPNAWKHPRGEVSRRYPVETHMPIAMFLPIYWNGLRDLINYVVGMM